MNDVAKRQLAVLEEFIADELRYMEEEGIEDSAVLDLLQQAAMDATLGKVLDESGVIDIAQAFYDATSNEFTGDTDMSDWLEEKLLETLTA